MRNADDPKQILVLKTGIKYDVHVVLKDEVLNGGKKKGTIVVKNPLYNPAAAQEYLYFQPGEVEVYYKEKENNSWFERQKRMQEQSGSESQER